ncbi:uncharacterized protein Hap1MRO34_002389 [Clarias gariepinus]
MVVSMMQSICAVFSITVMVMSGYTQSASLVTLKTANADVPYDTYDFTTDITNRIYNDSLLNPNSQDYTMMYNEVSNALNSVYGCPTCDTQTFYKGVTAMTFSNKTGSVDVQATLVFYSDQISSVVIKNLFLKAISGRNEIIDLKINSKFTQVIPRSDPALMTTSHPTTTPTTSATPNITYSTAPANITITTTPTTATTNQTAIPSITPTITPFMIHYHLMNHYPYHFMIHYHSMNHYPYHFMIHYHSMNHYPYHFMIHYHLMNHYPYHFMIHYHSMNHYPYHFMIHYHSKNHYPYHFMNHYHLMNHSPYHLLSLLSYHSYQSLNPYQTLNQYQTLIPYQP